MWTWARAMDTRASFPNISELSKSMSKKASGREPRHAAMRETRQPESLGHSNAHRSATFRHWTRCIHGLLTTGSFLGKQFNAVGTCPAHAGVRILLSGHFIPAAILDEFIPFPTLFLLEILKAFRVARLPLELGDADRRLTCQNRVCTDLHGCAGGCPPPPRKTDDHGDDAPKMRPQTPYLTFPAVSSFIDHSSLPCSVRFLPGMTLRPVSWMRPPSPAGNRPFGASKDHFHTIIFGGLAPFVL